MTGTRKLGSIPKTCDRKRAKHGIAVLCKIPKRFDNKKMFVRVGRGFGNDYVNGSILSRKFRLWVLADAGRDILYGGDGNDFVNGAKDADRVYGGAGNDFLRTGRRQ